jgi:xanthosine utilization system XapX-like protein
MDNLLLAFLAPALGAAFVVGIWYGCRRVRAGQPPTVFGVFANNESK